MTETYRLIHLTKQRGLYSRNPDDVYTPMTSLYDAMRYLSGMSYDKDGGASHMK